MFKWFLSLIVIIFLGCGGSSSGGTDLNPFNVNVFDPYTEPEFKYAWHLQRVNTNIDSHINIFDVWNQGIFGDGVKVAVIDYDFDPYHEDITQNVISTFNVDINSTQVRKFQNDHGTGAASLIAAAYNGKGTIGVAPKAKLILIDSNVTYVDSRSDDTSKIKAFYKARELGAKVISCSWGTLNVSLSVAQTIKELYDDNITIIFGSGNRMKDLDQNFIYSEAELDEVIGVGASTESNIKADYSNYGDNIDILAPGGTGSSGTVAAIYYNGYTTRYNGTSASAPIVAGVVALMLEVNPNLTPDQVREILIKTADKIDSANANYDNNGFSHTHSFGKVNAARAVSLAKTY